MNVSFDTRAIVKNFGGAAAIIRLYEKHDLQISRSAINNWVKRKAIHGKQIATLIRLAKRSVCGLILRILLSIITMTMFKMPIAKITITLINFLCVWSSRS